MNEATTGGPRPTADFSAFRAFIERDRAGIIEEFSHDLRELSLVFHHASNEILRQRAEDHLNTYVTALDQPEILPAYLSASIGPLINQQMEITSLLRILAMFRQHFIDRSLDAIAQGVPNATEGFKGLMSITDNAAHIIADMYHSKLYEGIHEQTNELRATKQRLEQSYSNTPLSTIEWDKNGTILFWNPSAERIFGWSAEEAVGQNIVELLVPDVAREHVQQIVETLLRGELANSRNANRTKSGRIITCQWYNAVLRDERGDVTGAISQTEDISDQIRSDEERVALQQQVIDAQAAALRELSTPLIPLAERVVAMPLIGTIDSNRAQQVIEELLNGVGQHHAQIAILDITGVLVVDTQVANALIRAAQAVKLLGAQVILTGIRPEVAQTLVGLGVDLGNIITRSSLQSGIAYAFERNKR